MRIAIFRPTPLPRGRPISVHWLSKVLLQMHQILGPPIRGSVKTLLGFMEIQLWIFSLHG